MSAPALLPFFEALLPEALDWLEDLVRIESHSRDREGVERLAADLARRLATFDVCTEVLAAPPAGSTLRGCLRGVEGVPPVLLLGHLDTVWPKGTIDARPFRIGGGRAFGPGAYDMKAGLVLVLLVCRALKEGKCRRRGEVRILFTGDEETGTAGGLPFLKESATGCRAVLCLEPPLPGGKAKTFRKGVGVFRIRVRGIAAHAGVEPERGASAILELCRQVVTLHGMNRPDSGISVSAGIIRGGTASNVVPAEGEAEVDVRIASIEQGIALEAGIRGLRPFDSRCSLEIVGGMNRPPLERTEAVVDLYRKARAAAMELGRTLGEGGTGGGSDGSFTAAMGIPTLDGLGVDGGGAHAEDEHVEISDLPWRAALLCRLLEALD